MRLEPYTVRAVPPIRSCSTAIPLEILPVVFKLNYTFPLYIDLIYSFFIDSSLYKSSSTVLICSTCSTLVSVLIPFNSPLKSRL